MIRCSLVRRPDVVWPSSCGRFSSNVGSDVIKPASSLVILDPAIHDILWGHDVRGIPELKGMRFDLMRHIHKLI